MIEQVTKVSKGLFHPNPAVRVLDATKSGQFYNAGIPVDKLAQVMKENDLVLRVSMKGDDNACAMARHADLKENQVISSPSGSFSLGVENGLSAPSIFSRMPLIFCNSSGVGAFVLRK